MWLPLVCPTLGTWPATQACVLTLNYMDDHFVRRLALNPLSHTSQGGTQHFKVWVFLLLLLSKTNKFIEVQLK